MANFFNLTPKAQIIKAKANIHTHTHTHTHKWDYIKFFKNSAQQRK